MAWIGNRLYVGNLGGHDTPALAIVVPFPRQRLNTLSHPYSLYFEISYKVWRLRMCPREYHLRSIRIAVPSGVLSRLDYPTANPHCVWLQRESTRIQTRCSAVEYYLCTVGQRHHTSLTTNEFLWSSDLEVVFAQRHHHWSSVVRGCRLSATELSRPIAAVRVWNATSRLHRRQPCEFSAVVSRLIPIFCSEVTCAIIGHFSRFCYLLTTYS